MDTRSEFVGLVKNSRQSGKKFAAISDFERTAFLKPFQHHLSTELLKPNVALNPFL